MSTQLEIVILAAGKGSRMRSRLPKVLHSLAGAPMLHHVLQAAKGLKPATIHVVVGHGVEQVKAEFSDAAVNWVVQSEQNGTGHAVAQALPDIDPNATVLIMNGDVPLITAASLQAVCGVEDGIHLLTVRLDNPTGFGRIVRDSSQAVVGIVEEKDADEAVCQIKEINTGLMAMPARQLSQWLSEIKNNNAQGEYYLTDVIALAVKSGKPVVTSMADKPDQVMGVNCRSELAYLERVMQGQRASTLMDQGVSLADPARIDLRGTVEVGSDTEIDINVLLENSQIGSMVGIGPGVVIRNSRIGDGVQIEAHSVIDGAVVHNECHIGPFARLRPETELAAQSCIGNFVEIKKSRIGEGSKVNHLSYVGDATVGKNTNIGAGVITCNYDGAYKHQTDIGDHVFVGSDCQLIAPVTVGDGATIGAGSTIAKNVPASGLTLSRSKQRSISEWQRPVKK